MPADEVAAEEESELPAGIEDVPTPADEAIAEGEAAMAEQADEAAEESTDDAPAETA